MRVTVHQHSLRICRQQFRRSRAAEFMTVAHVNTDAADVEHECFVESRVARQIGIAENRAHRRDRFQFNQYVVRSDIASM